MRFAPFRQFLVNIDRFLSESVVKVIKETALGRGMARRSTQVMFDLRSTLCAIKHAC